MYMQYVQSGVRKKLQIRLLLLSSISFSSHYPLTVLLLRAADFGADSCVQQTTNKHTGERKAFYFSGMEDPSYLHSITVNKNKTLYDLVPHGQSLPNLQALGLRVLSKHKHCGGEGKGKWH